MAVEEAFQALYIKNLIVNTEADDAAHRYYAKSVPTAEWFRPCSGTYKTMKAAYPFRHLPRRKPGAGRSSASARQRAPPFR
jgi:hypothetical protein